MNKYFDPRHGAAAALMAEAEPHISFDGYKKLQMNLFPKTDPQKVKSEDFWDQRVRLRQKYMLCHNNTLEKNL